MNEKVRVISRMQADLGAVCSELLSITGSVDNLWFLRFLSSRDDLLKLARMRRGSLLKIPGIGKKYAGGIQGWQREAKFSQEVEYVGPMIISDARRILKLLEEIAALEGAIEEISQGSDIARRLDSIPGLGKISSAELAGEIGTPERFTREAGLAFCTWGCALWTNSPESPTAPRPRGR